MHTCMCELAATVRMCNLPHPVHLLGHMGRCANKFKHERGTLWISVTIRTIDSKHLHFVEQFYARGLQAVAPLFINTSKNGYRNLFTPTEAKPSLLSVGRLVTVWFGLVWLWLMPSRKTSEGIIVVKL